MTDKIKTLVNYMRITIIGDSSSSCLGESKEIYPYLLYNKLSQATNCTLNNFSTPGFTSSDAKYLFYNKIKNIKNDYVIIYLGNNDSAYSLKKTKLNFFLWRLKKIFYNKDNTFTYLTGNKFEYFDMHSQSHEIACTSNEFKTNIESIVKQKSKNTKIIIINPIANEDFIPATGAINFEYFKIINFFDKIGPSLKFTSDQSKKLIDGIRLQEENNFDEAKKIYEGLIGNKDKIELIAKNNLAVINFSQGRKKLAHGILKDLRGLYEEYNSILYYNLGETSDNERDMKKYLKLSYEKDFSSYRIKENYRTTIHHICKNNDDVICLDLKKILSKKNFVDYCHPDNLGHKKIAENLFKMILDTTSRHNKTQRKCEFKNYLSSPDYNNFPNLNLIKYYKFEEKVDLININKELQIFLKENNYKNQIEFNTEKIKKKYNLNLLNFIKKNSTHPIFTTSMINCVPLLQHEISNYSENYIYKILSKYFIYFKTKCPEINNRLKLDKKNCNYNDLIYRNNNHDLNFKLPLNCALQIEIEKKLVLFIEYFKNKLFKENIYNRLKTIIYWYTRELFRYGTLSRNSMMYEIATIDKVIETLVVLITINHVTKKHSQETYIQIINNFISLKELHEKFTEEFKKKRLITSNYNLELEKNKKKIFEELSKLNQ